MITYWAILMYSNFSTTTHGKWILAGEHAVVRGHAAIVFPVPEYKLTLDYSYHDLSRHLTIEVGDHSGEEIGILLRLVLEKAQRLINDAMDNLHGHFHIDCNIPIGAGLGASAALCVAVAQWYAAQRLIKQDDLEIFARELEHLFHGQSSGLDIQGVATGVPIYFQRGHARPIQPKWQPHWYLSSCGQRGITADCIDQVNQLWQKSESEGLLLDTIMHDSTNKALQALETPASPQTLVALCNALKTGADCFYRWDLISETLAQHIQLLYQRGALAVKPTGSGKGGFVVSLWEKPITLSKTANDETITFISA